MYLFNFCWFNHHQTVDLSIYLQVPHSRNVVDDGVGFWYQLQAKRQKLSTSGVSCKRLFVPQPALLVRIESDRFFCLDGRFVRLARKVNNGDRSSLPPIQSDTMQSRPQSMLLIFYCQFSFVNEIKLVENY